MVGIGEERGRMLQAEPSDQKLNHGLNLSRVRRAIWVSLALYSG